MKLKLGIPKGSLENATVDLFRRAFFYQRIGLVRASGSSNSANWRRRSRNANCTVGITITVNCAIARGAGLKSRPAFGCSTSCSPAPDRGEDLSYSTRSGMRS